MSGGVDHDIGQNWNQAHVENRYFHRRERRERRGTASAIFAFSAVIIILLLYR